jgi:hypothetical protein
MGHNTVFGYALWPECRFGYAIQAIAQDLVILYGQEHQTNYQSAEVHKRFLKACHIL